MKNKGFTLVELSIVLVIIGLLTGGILGAQSLIKSSKISSFTSQLSQFDANINGFMFIWKALPGDSQDFRGDNNGLVDMGASSGWPSYINSYAGEIANFWGSLDPDEYKPTTTNATPGAIPVLSGPDKNVPISKLGKDSSFIFVSAIASNGTARASAADIRNFYAIQHSSVIPSAITNCCYQLAPNTTSNSAVKPSDAQALDKKIDDGFANSGIVISGRRAASSSNNGGIISTPLTECGNGGSNYNLNNKDYVCTPLIQIGGSIGSGL